MVVHYSTPSLHCLFRIRVIPPVQPDCVRRNRDFISRRYRIRRITRRHLATMSRTICNSSDVHSTRKQRNEHLYTIHYTDEFSIIRLFIYIFDSTDSSYPGSSVWTLSCSLIRVVVITQTTNAVSWCLKRSIHIRSVLLQCINALS